MRRLSVFFCEFERKRHQDDPLVTGHHGEASEIKGPAQQSYGAGTVPDRSWLLIRSVREGWKGPLVVGPDGGAIRSLRAMRRERASPLRNTESERRWPWWHGSVGG